jgi:hypothetical protein
MALESPTTTVFNSDGYEGIVKDGSSLPAQSAAFLLAGSDGTNTHYISLDSESRQLAVGAGTSGSPVGGLLSTQGTAGTGDELKVMGHIDIDNFPADLSIVQDTASELLANVGGLGASGSATVGNPVRLGASDGVDTKDLLSDSTGKLVVVGAADSGSPLAGAPARIAAKNSTNAVDILADAAGRLISVGAADAGDAVAGSPLRLGGSDGADTTDILTDSAGRLIYVGAAAKGAAIAGSPVRIGASDSGDITRDVLSDSQGRLIMVGAAAAGTAPEGFPILAGGWDGTNVRIFKLDSNGAVQVNETKADSAIVTTHSVSASDITLLAANNNREGAIIYNNSNRPMYIKFGSAASTSSFTVKLASFDYYEVPAGFTGEIHALWGDGSASGDARVTELIVDGSGFVTITINGAVYQITSETQYNLVEPPTQITVSGDGTWQLYLVGSPNVLINSGNASAGTVTLVPDESLVPGSYHIVLNDGTNTVNVYFDVS